MLTAEGPAWAAPAAVLSAGTDCQPREPSTAPCAQRAEQHLSPQTCTRRRGCFWPMPEAPLCGHHVQEPLLSLPEPHLLACGITRRHHACAAHAATYVLFVPDAFARPTKSQACHCLWGPSPLPLQLMICCAPQGVTLLGSICNSAAGHITATATFVSNPILHVQRLDL
jgi:hypothetical protein